MTDWMLRARAEIPCISQGRTAKTDETPLLSVSSVPMKGVFTLHDPLSSVSSVGVGGVFENQHIPAALMDAAMKVCDEHNDNGFAREEMRGDILGTPLHLHHDLLDHFTGKFAN